MSQKLTTEGEAELRKQARASGNARAILADYYEESGQPSRAAMWRDLDPDRPGGVDPELLDALHEHALVAWDRDVRLTPRELGDRSVSTEGNITIAITPGPEQFGILGYAFVKTLVCRARPSYRLTIVDDDPLGVRWIDCLAIPPEPGSEIDSVSPKACGTGYSCSNCYGEFCWTCEAPMLATASNAKNFQIKTIGSRYCEATNCLTAEATAHRQPIEIMARLRKEWLAVRYVHHDCLNPGKR